MLDMKVEGAEELAKALQQFSEDISDQLEAGVSAGAMMLEGQIKNNAPYKTGDYRRSIHHETREKSQDRVVIAIGTDRPQGARLEYGFSDTDKLGRRYNQPPQPHFRPTIEQNKQNVQQEISYAIQEALRARRG